jgi:2-methylisocitrate lyase-like PEP mutase family enzyme
MAVSSTSKEVHAPSFAQEASAYIKPSTMLRQLMAEPGCVPAPGVYDGISARLALEAGFPCLVSKDL